MKLKTTLLAAACTLALSASAATFTPGKQAWPPISNPVAGSSEILFNCEYSKTVSQNIYSSTELSEILPKVSADGSSKDVAVITSLQLPFDVEGAYVFDGSIDVYVYLTPYEAGSFPTEDGTNFNWIDYSNEQTVMGLGTVSCDYISEELGGYGQGIIDVELEKPFEYNGQSIVLTVQCENSIDFDMGTFGGTFGYLSSGANCSKLLDNTTELSGTFKSPSKQLPVVNFIYETKHVDNAVVGEPAVFEVGDYDGCSSSSTSAGQLLPIDGDYQLYTYSQIIYTKSELKDLNKTSTEGLTKADITDLTFKLDNSQGNYYTGSLKGSVYIQNYIGTSFPLNDGIAQWIPVDTENAKKGDFATEEFEMDESPVFEITVPFTNSLRYEGESLVVTFVTTAPSFEDMMGNSMEEYTFKVNGDQAAVVTDSYPIESFQSGSITPSGTVRNEVPVLKLGYKPVTVAAAEKPVLFEDVVAAISKVDLASGVVYGKTESNNLSISFNLVNAEDNGKYAITLGNTQLGSVTGKHGVINFVAMPKNDLVLSVKPEAEGGLGGSYTLKIEDLEALFAAPVVEATDDKAAYAAYTAYNYYSHACDKSATIQAVAKFKVTLPEGNFAATIKGTTSSNQTQVVTSSNTMPDCFDSFRPAGEYNDYAANNGNISYYCSSFETATVDKGVFVAPSSTKNLEVKFSVEYPLVSKTTPSLDAAVATQLSDKSGVASSTVSRDYDNGESWNKTACASRFDFSAVDVTLNVEYPEKLAVDNTEGFITFYAPANHKIHYNWTPDPDAQEVFAARVKALAEQEVAWTEHDSNIYSHPTDVPGALLVKNVDADGNDVDTMSYAIDGEGNTTGIENVAVDNAAAAAEYFDLNGRRVSNPAAGIYILRQGSNVSKILVK